MNDLQQLKQAKEQCIADIVSEEVLESNRISLADHTGGGLEP